jgi:hypothetical protein
MNPGEIGSALGTKAMAKYIKTLNSPDHSIKTMFKDVDKIMSQKERLGFDMFPNVNLSISSQKALTAGNTLEGPLDNVAIPHSVTEDIGIPSSRPPTHSELLRSKWAETISPQYEQAMPSSRRIYRYQPDQVINISPGEGVFVKPRSLEDIRKMMIEKRNKRRK